MSNYIREITIRRTSQAPVGHWNFILDNSEGRYNGAFSPNNIVDILVDSVRLMKGYLDIARPVGKETPETKLEELMAVIGRDFGQDLDNLTIDKVYPIDNADDVIDDALATAGAEITYTSPSTAPQLSVEGKDDYLISLISYILSQIDFDAFVDENKAFQLFAQGADSGIMLKMVEDAEDNNILEQIQFDEADGLEIRNYIKVKGKLVEDGYTEGNADGWTGKAGNVVSNDLADFVYGGASIKCDKGTADECYLKLILPKYNYSSWALTKGELSQSFWIKDNEAPTYFYGIAIYLVDSSGNRIAHSSSVDGTAAAWNKTSAALGPDVEIGVGKPWNYSVGSSFNWGAVTELWILTHSNVDILKIDGLCLPVRMYAFSQDATSQGLYRTRKLPLERQDIESQVELQAYADDYKSKRKDPLSAIRLTAKGEAGLLGDPKTNKWIPGYKLLVNAPPAGINNVEYRMLDVVHRLSRNAGKGHTHLVDLYLVKNTVKVDKIRWLLAHDPEFAVAYLMREKLKYLQRMEETLATGWMEPPKPLDAPYIKDDSLYEGKFGFSPHGLNLIANPSFEQDSNGDGLPDRWVPLVGAGTPIFARSSGAGALHGIWSARIDCDAGDSGLWYSDVMEVAYGEAYFVSVQTGQNNSNGVVEIWIDWFNQAKAYIGHTNVFSGAAQGSGWRKKSGQVTAPSGAYFAKIVLMGNCSASSANVFYFDDAKFSMVLMEPAEIATIIKNLHLLELILPDKVSIDAGTSTKLSDWRDQTDPQYFRTGKLHPNMGTRTNARKDSYDAVDPTDGWMVIRSTPGTTYTEIGPGGGVYRIIKFPADASINHILKEVQAECYINYPSNGYGTFAVEYSVNSGSTWNSFGSVSVTNTSYTEKVVSNTVSSGYNNPLWVRAKIGATYETGPVTAHARHFTVSNIESKSKREDVG